MSKPVKCCLVCGMTSTKLEEHYIEAHYESPSWKAAKAKERVEEPPWFIEKPSKMGKGTT